MNKSNGKLIFLLDCSKKDIDKLVTITSNYRTKFVDTIKAGVVSEYDYISKEIDTFLYSKNNVLIVKFSGATDVSRDVGDDYSEMLVTLSTRKGHKCYTENLSKTFNDMLLILNYEENM